MLTLNYQSRQHPLCLHTPLQPSLSIFNNLFQIVSQQKRTASVSPPRYRIVDPHSPSELQQRRSQRFQGAERGRRNHQYSRDSSLYFTGELALVLLIAVWEQDIKGRVFIETPG